MLEALPAGINLSAVFDINTLPKEILSHIQSFLEGEGEGDEAFTQLILFGHGGTDLWKAISQQGEVDEVPSPERPLFKATDPVDDYALRSLGAWFKKQNLCHRFLYPLEHEALKPSPIPLQALGQLAGWHYPSPMKVGINSTWGLWYAYRAVVLVNSSFPAIEHIEEGTNSQGGVSLSPCNACSSKPCISACPADALSDGTLRFERCAAFRLQPHSPCAQRCLAREACPVAAEHRYSAEQIQYHYSRSLETLKRYYSS